MILASTSDVGIKDNGSSQSVSLNNRGKKVAFTSTSTNLDPLDLDATSDIYMKNLATADIQLVSTSTGGTKANGLNAFPDLASNVDVVAFSSQATNLDPLDLDITYDVYVKDLATGTLTLASTTAAGVKANDTSFLPSISGGGRWVAFASYATNLDPADTDSLPDIYVKDLTTGALTLVSTSDNAVKGNGLSYQPSISGDGKRVAFYSESTNLDPADTELSARIATYELAFRMQQHAPEAVDLARETAATKAAYGLDDKRCAHFAK